MDEVARPATDDLVVVAGAEPIALLVTAAALRAGHAVVGLAEEAAELRGMVAGVDGALDTRRYHTTVDPQAGVGFSVALITEPAETDPMLSPIELHTAALAPHLRAGSLLVVSSATAEYAGDIAAATVELLTGLRAGSDYALGYLFPPAPRSRLIVSGIDAASSARTQAWLVGLGFPVMPVMPVAAAEVVAALLARAARPQDEH